MQYLYRPLKKISQKPRNNRQFQAAAVVKIVDYKIAMNKLRRFANSKFSGLILHLLLPGAGHVHFREYVFGIFVMLVWLIAAALFYLSFVIELNQWAKLILFGLPLVFYFFTFFDLLQSLKKKKDFKPRGPVFSAIIYAVAFVYQILAPAAPLNFLMANGPIAFVLNNHRLSPLHSDGTLMKVSRLAYQIDIVGFDKPIFHHVPERYDLVRYVSDNGLKDNAVVLGLPQEEIEIIEGTVIINGIPDFKGWIGGLTFNGNWPAEEAGSQELIVATLNLGAIDKIIQVPFTKLIGKVEPVFE